MSFNTASLGLQVNIAFYASSQWTIAPEYISFPNKVIWNSGDDEFEFANKIYGLRISRRFVPSPNFSITLFSGPRIMQLKRITEVSGTYAQDAEEGISDSFGLYFGSTAVYNLSKSIGLFAEVNIFNLIGSSDYDSFLLEYLAINEGGIDFNKMYISFGLNINLLKAK